jgi:hypothetical protein
MKTSLSLIHCSFKFFDEESLEVLKEKKILIRFIKIYIENDYLIKEFLQAQLVQLDVSLPMVALHQIQ